MRSQSHHPENLEMVNCVSAPPLVSPKYAQYFVATCRLSPNPNLQKAEKVGRRGRHMLNCQNASASSGMLCNSKNDRATGNQIQIGCRCYS